MSNGSGNHADKRGMVSSSRKISAGNDKDGNACDRATARQNRGKLKMRKLALVIALLASTSVLAAEQWTDDEITSGIKKNGFCAVCAVWKNTEP